MKSVIVYFNRSQKVPVYANSETLTMDGLEREPMRYDTIVVEDQKKFKDCTGVMDEGVLHVISDKLGRKTIALFREWLRAEAIEEKDEEKPK